MDKEDGDGSGGPGIVGRRPDDSRDDCSGGRSEITRGMTGTGVSYIHPSGSLFGELIQPKTLDPI